MLLQHLSFSTRYLDDVKAEWSLYVRYVFCPACGKDPPADQGESVGAALLVESLWQTSARLRYTSAVLKRNSTRLQTRSARLKSSLFVN